MTRVKVGRSVRGVHGSVTGAQNKSVTGSMGCNKQEKKCNGGIPSRFNKMYGAFLAMEMYK